MKKTIADAVIAIARREIGTVEKPKNSNNVKYNTWYYKQEVWNGKNGGKYPWCMAFVQWVFNEAGFPLPYKTASCSALLDWYKKNAPELVHSEPQRGDIVIYKGHTGIFEKIGPDPKYMYVIEGNTAVGNDDNGGAVMERYRKVSTALAFITPFKEKEDEDVIDYEKLAAAIDYETLASLIDFDKLITIMSPKQAYAIQVKAQSYAATLEAPGWAKQEIQEAINLGITDGRNPMVLIPRYQAAIMAKRAVMGQIEE